MNRLTKSPIGVEEALPASVPISNGETCDNVIIYVKNCITLHVLAGREAVRPVRADDDRDGHRGGRAHGPARQETHSIFYGLLIILFQINKAS